MRGIGAAARRGAHLPSSYAAALSSFSGGGGGAGRGRGNGIGQQPQRAPGRPISDDDDGADPFATPAPIGRGRGESAPTIPSFSAVGHGRGSPLPPPRAAADAPKQEITEPFSIPASVGRGRGESVVPSSPTIPSFSAFSGVGRGSPLPPAADDAPKRVEDASPAPDPERPGPGAFSSAPPRSTPSVGAGRGVPRFQQPPADKAPEENRFTRQREGKQQVDASSSAASTQPKLSAEVAVKRALELLGHNEDAAGRGGGGRGGRGGRRGGRSRVHAVRDEMEDMMYFGDDADGEKLEKRLGKDKMKILDEAFEEAADNALPHPMEDAYMDACHTNNMIEFEPEYHVNFDNPDIDEKPPMSLEEMLQKVKPFIVAYEGIKDQQEWEEAVKDVMKRAPHMKELIDMYSGPDVVTAKQQEEELQRVANTLPEKIPSSVNRFTDKMLLCLKNNPGWGFDRKCQFMDKYAREVSKFYK